MSTSTQETKMTQATGAGQEPKATKKARAAERRAVAPAKGKSGKKATSAQKAPTSPKNANPTSASPKQGKSKKTPPTPDGRARTRAGSKKAEVLELLHRKQGATLAEIMKATGCQAHSVRGFISGTLIKKQGLKVESFRSEDKERTYRATA